MKEENSNLYEEKEDKTDDPLTPEPTNAMTAATDLPAEEENGASQSVDIDAVSAKERKRAFYKGPRAVSYVLFAIAAALFFTFAMFTVPFAELFFTKLTSPDLGEALGQVFGIIFMIPIMFIVGIPLFLFSLLSAINFGRGIGVAEVKSKKILYIVLFVLSLLFLLFEIALAIAAGTVIVKAN